MIIQYPV